MRHARISVNKIFKLIDSHIKYQVKKENVKIPIENPIILPPNNFENTIENIM